MQQLTASGLFSYLGKRKNAGTLSDLAGSNGLIDCAFVACDGPYQYIDEYFEKLGSAAFRPIHNEVRLVLFCDLLYTALEGHHSSLNHL
jgi:hypothetical protein